MKVRYDTERLLKDADPVEVAREIGMKIKKETRQAKYTGILCPNPMHKDQHFGNCVIWPDGHYECFSCGDKGDVFRMVMQYTGVPFPEAVAIVADSCCGREPYILSGAAGEFHASTVPNQKECQLLGIYNTRVYVPVRYGKEVQVEAGERMHVETWTEQNEPLYRIDRCLEKNPLMELRKTDDACYKELLLQKAGEAIGRRKKSMTEPQKISESEAEHIEWCLIMERDIEKIEDILMKYVAEESDTKELFS